MAGLYPKANEDDGAVPASPQDAQTEKSTVISGDANGKVGKEGPVEHRTCKDILFLIIFILFWIGMFIVAGVAIKQGNLNRLKFGNDTEGNLCGVKNIVRDNTPLPNQYIFNPVDLSSYKKCVSKCPDTFGSIICTYDITPPQYDANISVIETLARLKFDGYDKNCTLTIKTKEVLNRCIPDPSQLKQLMAALNQTDKGQQLFQMYQDKQQLAVTIFSDIFDAWKTILICSLVALVLSFVWLFFVQFFAKIIIWITLIFVNVVGLALTAFLWVNWYQVRKGNSSYVSQYLPSGQYNEEVLLALAGIVSFVVFIVLLLTIALRGRINLAVGLITEASKAVRAMPFIVFFPVLKYILLALLTAWTIYIWSLLSTSGTVQQQLTDNLSEQLNYQFEPNRVYQMLTIYYALGFFWTFNWIIAISQSTIAGAIAGWYWTRDKKSIPIFPIWKAFFRTCRFHLGSLAFGSLILAVVQTIRGIIFYFQTQLKKSNSRAAKMCLGCLQCCFACVEKTIKFLNKNAYIEIAVYGYNFCEGAKQAFQLLVRNSVRLMVLDEVSDFLLFLGKLMITMATCLIGLFMLQSKDADDTSRFWAVPLILIAISSYVIASSFMAVFDMSINTMFLCFCEDSERNDGQGKPYYMPDSLRKFIDDATKQAPKV